MKLFLSLYLLKVETVTFFNLIDVTKVFRLV